MRHVCSRDVVERVVADAFPAVVLMAPEGHGTSSVLAEVATIAGDGAVLNATHGAAPLLDRLSSAEPGRWICIDALDTLDPDDQRTVADAIEVAVAGGGRVAVSCRVRPALPLRRWQVDGLVDVVTADQLVLSRGDVGAELHLTGTDLDAAMAATGGWPSSVALLRGHLLDRPLDRDRPLDAALRVTRGDHVDFVADEVLAVLDPSDRHLLTRLSVLDVLVPAVVAVVAADPSAPGRVAEIADRTQLLEARGADWVWRGDVRSALRRELERRDRLSIPTLHRLAAQAVAHDRRQTATHVEHLVEAEEWDDVLALLVERWTEFAGPDGFDVLVETICRMPDGFLSHDVRASLAAGAVMLESGHSTLAAQHLDADCVHADRRAVATAAALRAHATWWSIAPERALDHVDQAEAILAAEPGVDLVPVVGYETITTGRTMLSVSRARALALNGRVAEAVELCAVVVAADGDDPVAESVAAWSTRAFVDAIAGHLVEAADAAELAFTLALDGGWSGRPALAPAHLARALIAQRSGADDDRRADVAAAGAIAVRVRAWGLLRMVRAVAGLCGDVDRPLPSPDDDGPARVPLADRIIAACAARAAARAADTARAAALLSATEPAELALDAWVEASIAVHGRAATAAALRSLPDPTTPAGRVVRLLAEAELAQGDVEVADRAAGAAIAAGLVGLLRHASPELRGRLGAITGATVGAAARRSGVGAPPGPSDDEVPVLSDREREVLDRLDGPLPVADIGRELFLSGHTVKWYVSRLYRKLGVHTRADAVARARSLGLLGAPLGAADADGADDARPSGPLPTRDSSEGVEIT